MDELGIDIKFFEGLLSIFLSQFRQIMETQFISFNASVNVTNFEALSACIFSWLEEYCKPQVSGLYYLCGLYYIVSYSPSMCTAFTR